MSFSKQNNPYYETKTTTIVLLYIVTLGFYEHYWHFKNWKAIKNNSGDLSLSPFLRALFYPFFILSLISVIKGSCEITGLRPGVAKTWFGVLYIAISLITWSLSGEIYIFVFMFSVLPIYFLQRKTSEINQLIRERNRHSNKLIADSKQHDSGGSCLAYLAKKQFEYQKYFLPHKYSVELSVFVIVLVVCTSFALHDAERAIAKAKLTEILTLVTSAKNELGELYALTGSWTGQDLEYVHGGSSTSTTKRAYSTSDGVIHFELNKQAPFEEGDILSFPIRQDDYTGPMHINRWQCNRQQGDQINLTTVSEEFLPSICRG